MTTKNLIPRGSGEGGIGITDVTWGYGYYDTGNFNKGLFVSGHNITQVIAETVTQGGLGGEWERNVLDIYYNGGNVGIGTAQPVTRLHIKGPNNTTFDNIGNIYSEGTDAYDSTNAGCGIQFGGQYNAAGDDAVFGQISAIKENTADGDYKGVLTFGSRDGATLNMEAMRINSTGNVGIGTTSPGGKLEVNGGILINATLPNVGDNLGLWLGKNSQVQGYVGGGDFAVNGINDTDFGISSAANGNLVFGTDVGDERMRITSAGNVGIGTTDPGAYNFVLNDNDANSRMKISCNPSSQASLFFGEDAGGGGTPAWIQRYGSTHATKANKVEVGAAGTGSWVAIQGDGGDVLNVRGSGYVGIGTTDPGANLEIKGGSEPLAIYDATDEQKLRVFTAVNGTVLSLTDGGEDIIRLDGRTSTPNSSYFNGGNVGIGTTDPGAKLDVLHFSNTEVACRFNNAGGSAPATVHIVEDNIVPTHVGLFVGASDLSSAVLMTKQSNVGIGTPDPGGYSPSAVGKYKLDISSSESLFMGCDDANQGIRTANTNKSFRVGGASYQYSDASSIVAINSLFCGSDNTANRLGIGFGTSAMQAPSEIMFGTQAYDTFNQASNHSGTLTNRRLRIDNNGILVYGLSVSSDVQTNSSGYLTTASDKRLKNDLGDCEYGLSEVLQVQPKKYTWKDGPEDAAATIGFFAQDVHSIMPEAAPREAVKNENGEDDYKWGFHSQTIIAALVNATKEQQQLIEDLRSEIEALKNK